MRKSIFVLLAVIIIASIVGSSCGSNAPDIPSGNSQLEESYNSSAPKDSDDFRESIRESEKVSESMSESVSESERESIAESERDSQSESEIESESISESVNESEDDSEPTDNKWFKFTLLDDGSGYSVAKCDDYDESTYPTKIVIPDTYNNMPVASIGDWAFSYCYSLTSVTIPDGVTSIGSYTFSDCSSLTSVVIPSSVTSIGYKAFSYCDNLEQMVVSPSNEVYSSVNNCIIEKSSKTLVTGCKTSIIPSDGSVTSIGKYAFSYCWKSTSVEIPNSVTSIGEGAFDGCSNLTSVEIPNSVTSIGEGAFRDCSNLTSVIFSGTIAQWKNVEKGSWWLDYTKVAAIKCSDGEASIYE